MKAYNLHGVDDFRYEDVPMPECNPGWAIIEVRAAGICSSDISRVFTKGTYHFPTIPGHEFSGVVYEVGSEEDKDLLGKKVGCFPLIPCKKCAQCGEGHYELCSNYDYVGSRRDGAFAQYVAIPVWNLLVLPEEISYEYAAMLEPLAVGLHATRMAAIKEGDRIAVVGTGMIGICAAQWARKFSNTDEVYIIGRNEIKRKIVESNNLKYINQNKDIISGEYNVVIEAVGSPSSIDTALNIVSPSGTVVLMGNPSDNISLTQATYWRILRKQLTVRGTWNSSYAGTEPSDWTEAVRALSEGSIRVANLISHKFDQGHVAEGFNMMRKHKEPYCKVMTIWNKK